MPEHIIHFQSHFALSRISFLKCICATDAGWLVRRIRVFVQSPPFESSSTHFHCWRPASAWKVRSSIPRLGSPPSHPLSSRLQNQPASHQSKASKRPVPDSSPRRRRVQHHQQMHNANATHIHAPLAKQIRQRAKEKGKIIDTKLLVLGLRRARCRSGGQIPPAIGNFAKKQPVSRTPSEICAGTNKEIWLPSVVYGSKLEVSL